MVSKPPYDQMAPQLCQFYVPGQPSFFCLTIIANFLCIEKASPPRAKKLSQNFGPNCLRFVRPAEALARAPRPRGPGPWAKGPGPLGQGARAPGPRGPLNVPTHNTTSPYRHTIQAYHTDTQCNLKTNIQKRRITVTAKQMHGIN